MFYAYGYDKNSTLTRLETWNRIKKKTGKWIGDDKPEYPKAGYLWIIYCEIREGTDRVTWQDIDSYSRLMGDKLAPWEIKLLFEIERLRHVD